MKKTKLTAVMVLICVLLLQSMSIIMAYGETEDNDILNVTELTELRYEEGTVVFGRNITKAQLLVAQYNDEDALTELKKYEITDAEEFVIPENDLKTLSGTVKFMLWTDLGDIKPLSKTANEYFEAEIVTPTPNADSVELYAEDIDTSKSDGENNLIYFYPHGETKDSVRYALSDGVQYYVNGIQKNISCAEALEIIINTPTAMIKLQKGSETSAYSKVIMSVSKTAVVDENSDKAIYFKYQSDEIGAKLRIDEANAEYTFTLNGQKINPSEIKEYDVLTIYYDIDDFEASPFYNIEVSRDIITDRYTGCSADRRYVAFGGTSYKTALDLGAMIGNLEFSVKYSAHLDTFGRIAYITENSTLEKMGVFKNIYRKANGDYIAEIITKEGTVKEYLIEDKNVEEYKALIDSAKGCEERIISYQTTVSGKLRNVRILDGEGQADAIYRQSANAIGSYKISDNTAVIDASNIKSHDSNFNALPNRLIDGNQYTVYAYDKSSLTGSYRLLVITEGELAPIEEEYTESIGILKNVYQNVTFDYVAEVITKEGIVKKYLIDYQNAQEYMALIDSSSGYESRVIIYKSTKSDKIIINEILNGTEKKGNYDKLASELCSIKLTESTAMIDVSDNAIKGFEAVTADRLIENEEYTTYYYNKSTAENNSYELILFISGRIEEAEEVYTEGIGILKNVYQNVALDYVAEVITKDGVSEEYLIDDRNGEAYEALVSDKYDSIKDSYINQVVRYKFNQYREITIISTDESGNLSAETAEHSTSEYQASTSQIGTIKMSDETVIIDISDVNRDKNNYFAVSKDVLRNGAEFYACGYAPDENGCYSFVIIAEGQKSFNSASQMAIFLQSDTDFDDEGNILDVVEVYHDNEKKTLIVDDSCDADFYSYNPGDPIIFSQNHLGYIDRIYGLCSSNVMIDGDYQDFKEYVFSGGEVLNNVEWSGLLSDNIEKNVDIQFGILIQDNDCTVLATEIGRDDDGCYINLDSAVKLDISRDTTIYSYNYAKKWMDNNRIELYGNLRKTPNISDAHGVENNKYYISHKNVEEKIVFAFVRAFNGGKAQEIYQIINVY